MPRNIDEFNKSAARIFSDLYEAFPLSHRIAPHEYVDSSGGTDAQVDEGKAITSKGGEGDAIEMSPSIDRCSDGKERAKAWLSSLAIFQGTLEFLEAEALIRSKPLPGGCRSYCLTAKAFSHLNLRFQEGEVGPHTVASRIKQAIGERSLDALFACIPIAISGGVSS